MTTDAKMHFPAEKQTYKMAYEAMSVLRQHDRGLTALKEDYMKSRRQTISTTLQFCRRAGITEEDLDRLAVIHVTGTKGKGSTCALTERILAHHGYTTGLLSSPHSQDMRERIRINCKPISEDLFSRYFWTVYNAIVSSQESADDPLPYPSQFYTMLAFKVFLGEKVDAVILEVGVGGEIDPTNIIRHPLVCTVTNLGIDHVNLLGDTIASIGWHKGGIFKTGAIAFTLEQPEDGLSVLLQRAQEKQCPLYLIPPYSAYDWGGTSGEIGIAGKMQEWNASLAIQMAHAWMERKDLSVEERSQLFVPITSSDKIPTAKSMSVHKQTRLGLKNCIWPGRHQIIRHDDVIYYLDAAHTEESMQFCAEWVKEKFVSDAQNVNGHVTRLLLYNLRDNRPKYKLLAPFAKIEFDGVVFCPNITDDADFARHKQAAQDGLKKCWYNRAVWLDLLNDDPDLPRTTAHVCSNVQQALEWCHQYKQDSSLLQILINGGMRIVGHALKFLDPEMNDRDPEITLV